MGTSGEITRGYSLVREHDSWYKIKTKRDETANEIWVLGLRARKVCEY
jgi:hypothetical protein